MRTHAAAELHKYLEQLRAQRFSKALILRAQLVLPRFFPHLRDEGVRDLRQVEEAHVVAFARRLQEQQLSAWTRAAYLSAVKGFFRFLEQRRVILQNPADKLPLPRGQRLPHARLSESEARRLMSAPWPGSMLGKRDRALLETLYGMGLRCSECSRLDCLDVDLTTATLFVRDGKGKRDRVLPITGRAVAALDVYLQDARPELVKQPREGALFLSRMGERLGPQSVRLIAKKHARAAGITRNVTAHLLRHACATHLLRNGADVRHIQKLLGHRRLETTALYTRVEIADLRAAIEKSHPRERRWRRRGGG